ncbi:hypothetical protein [Microbacterium sp. bgisy203]|uniref:hypothetical protein n=1 Tax=Microbacterium sp. bgisy203 TaxID=3413799 RepID=UPI003D71DCE1
MPPTRALRREGLLTALDADEPGLAIGDAAARHVRLTTRGATAYVGDDPGAFAPWSQIRAIVIDPPTTWAPNPALVDSIGPIVEGLFGGIGGIVEETPTFEVRVEGIDGEPRVWRATLHYLSGYRKKDARFASRLIDALVGRPETRALLAHPAELLDRLGKVVRETDRWVT